MTTDRRQSLTPTRMIGLGAAEWGGLLLLRGPELWRLVAGDSPTKAEQRAIRVLGCRHLAQGALQALAPARLQRLWVAVDVTHAVSMVVLAALDPGRRRPAIVSAAVAAASAGLTGVQSVSGQAGAR